MILLKNELIRLLIVLLCGWCGLAPAHAALHSSAPHTPAKSIDFRGNCRDPYHNPETGRFWTQDSYEGNQSDPLSLHKYTYCHNNPVNAFDPSGQMTLSEVGQSIGIWGMNVLRSVGMTGLGAPPAVIVRVVIGIAVIGTEGLYVLNRNPGLAALKLTDGKVLGGSLPPSSWSKSPQSYTDFIKLLDEQASGSVMEVVITGHADDEGITTGYDYSYATALVGPLQRVLARPALVSLNGCHSAGAAKIISAAIPGVTVIGYKDYILGGNAVGYNGVVFPSGLTVYQNGQELP